MAPEIHLEHRYSTHSDVWSYGVTIWEVLSLGETPYWDWTPETISKVVLEGYRLPPPKNCYHNMNLLMLSCWTFDASLRPSFLKIMRNLEQFRYYLEKQILYLSEIDNTNKSNEMSQDYMQTLLTISKNGSNDSMDNVDTDNYQPLKHKENCMLTKG